MTLTTELSPLTFGLLFGCTILSTWLSGTTVQWTLNKGLLEKKLFEKANQYNVLVAIAGTSSMIHTLLCFFNNIMYPNLAFGVGISVVVNWTIMTNSSIMLVSQRLSLTFQSPKLAWKRLLWINYMALPCCILIGTSWAISHNTTPQFPNLDKFVLIIEPIQIALFGIVEFLLSGAFIVQMWKYRWTDVERHGMFMLFLVGACDLVSVLLNLMMGDLESTCVKGLVYSIRIRLEVNVLCCMVDYIKNRRGRVTYGTPSTNTHTHTNNTHNTNAARTGFFAIKSGQRPSNMRSKIDSELDRLRDELQSSAASPNGHAANEQAPIPASRRNVPASINPSSQFTVSQLRTSTTESNSPPHDSSSSNHSDDDNSQEFTNDFFRQHYLQCKREEEEAAAQLAANTKQNQKPPELKRDTSSTMPVDNDYSMSFHDEDDGIMDLEAPTALPGLNLAVSVSANSEKTLQVNNSSSTNPHLHNKSAIASSGRSLVDSYRYESASTTRSADMLQVQSPIQSQQQPRSSYFSVGSADESSQPQTQQQQDDCRRYSATRPIQQLQPQTSLSTPPPSSSLPPTNETTSPWPTWETPQTLPAGPHTEQDLEAQLASLLSSSQQPQPQQQYAYEHKDDATELFYECHHSESQFDQSPSTSPIDGRRKGATRKH